MLKEVEGIVVQMTPFRESSIIINVLTKDGLIGILVRGGRSIKNKWRASTAKLTLGKYLVKGKEKSLSVLVEGEVINNFVCLKRDLIKMSYALYLLDLAKQISKDEINFEIYDDLLKTILKMEAGYDVEVLSNILEIKYLKHLGVMPVIDKCVLCGNTTDIVTISSYRGGYVCQRCLTTEKIINIKTIKLVRMFYYIDISKIDKLEISPNIKLEINEFIADYYDRYTGLYLKTKEFIKKLSEVG